MVDKSLRRALGVAISDRAPGCHPGSDIAVSLPSRGDRRRKLLRDDQRRATDTAELPSTKGRARRRIYSERALASRQPRITDFLPKRRLTLFLLWLLGLLPPAGILSAGLFSQRWIATWDVAAQRPLALLSVGGMARAWSSVMLLATAAACMLVFHLRRHRLDDYRGQYRLWIGAVAVLLLASLDTVTDLHETLGACWQHISGRTTPPNGWVWGWLLLAAIPWVRALLDMRGNRFACAISLLAGGSWGLVAVMVFHAIPVSDPQLAELLTFVGMHLGNQLLLFSVLVYARGVYRTAQGESRSERSIRKSPSRSRAQGSSPAQPATERIRSRGASQEPRDGRIDEDSDPNTVDPQDADRTVDFGAPSRSELRRRKKELRKQQRRAA